MGELSGWLHPQAVMTRYVWMFLYFWGLSVKSAERRQRRQSRVGSWGARDKAVHYADIRNRDQGVELPSTMISWSHVTS
jgi:hypothetical protein